MIKREREISKRRNSIKVERGKKNRKRDEFEVNGNKASKRDQGGEDMKREREREGELNRMAVGREKEGTKEINRKKEREKSRGEVRDRESG